MRDDVLAEIVRPQGCPGIFFKLELVLGWVDEQVAVARANRASAAYGRVLFERRRDGKGVANLAAMAVGVVVGEFTRGRREGRACHCRWQFARMEACVILYVNAQMTLVCTMQLSRDTNIWRRAVFGEEKKKKRYV